LKFDQLLVDHKVAASKSEARRLIKQNAVKLRWNTSDVWHPIKITDVVPRLHDAFDLKAGYKVIAVPESGGSIENELDRLDGLLMSTETEIQSAHYDLQFAIVNGRRAYLVYCNLGRKIGCTLVKMAVPKKAAWSESGELDGLDDATIIANALSSAQRLAEVII
jgi:hypothetical protein